MKTNDYNNYFNNNATSWIKDGYTTDGYNYKTPANRLRVISSFLDTTKDIKTAIDIGCGGGHVSIELAKHNINVQAVDMSETMLQEAKKNISLLSENIQKNISLSNYEFSEIPNVFYDCAVAMGLIGYLDNDDIMFKKLNLLVNKGGYAIISFRNRLFNLFSISHRTTNECKNGTIFNLIKEFESISKEIDINDTKLFLMALNSITQQLLLNIDSFDKSYTNTFKNEYSDTVEPRQTTPNEAINIANKYGFKPLKIIGIHPHFLIPKLNNCLLPGIYNSISDSLIPLEEHPMSLLWSSVFIAFFKKEL